VLFIGDDWAEDHHDIEVEDEQGRRLARRRLPEGVAGIEALHALVADHLPDAAAANLGRVGIEPPRGPWVQALIAAGYTVYAVNPLQAARYRDRHGVSGAKSDAGDAHVLAELVRLDRAHHRPVAGDSAIAEHVKVLARAHQSLVWSRQRQNNRLRSMLREFYPGALDAFAGELDGRDALAVLAIAPTRPTGAGCPGLGWRPRCVGPDGSATWPPARPRSSRRCAPTSCRPGPVWRMPTAPACARWSRSSASSGTRPWRWPVRWRRVLVGTRTLRST